MQILIQVKLGRLLIPLKLYHETDSLRQWIYFSLVKKHLFPSKWKYDLRYTLSMHFCVCIQVTHKYQLPQIFYVLLSLITLHLPRKQRSLMRESVHFHLVEIKWSITLGSFVSWHFAGISSPLIYFPNKLNEYVPWYGMKESISFHTTHNQTSGSNNIRKQNILKIYSNNLHCI